MSWGVPGSGFDNHRSIAEDIIVVFVDVDRFALLQFTEIGGFGPRRRWIAEHDLALLLADKPGGLREQIGVSDVVPMEMRVRQISDVRRPVTDFGKLRLQRTPGGRITKRRRSAAGLE